MLAFALAAALLVPAAPAVAQTPGTLEFPAGYEQYHTLAEMEAALDDAVAAHPGLVRKFSIGRSYKGRPIWAVKISDNVATDEAEPEVLFDCNIHAREHLTTEMCLYVVRMLTNEYATNSRVRRLVNNLEIVIIPSLNPDGSHYDIASGSFRSWRKNRQPIPNASAIGVDPNRSYGFKWGCCDGSSNKPWSIEYRGWAPWVAPEVQAHRDYVNSRVVGGRQQIRLAISWHQYGELVMWPYSHTNTDVPRTMSADDHRALVRMGEQMAARNGYTAQQMSGLYIADGTSSDWLYHQHRILAYTFELYPIRDADARQRGGFYPPGSVVASETERNRGAVLWFLEQADCPFRAAGLGATHCGPLNDDFEASRGWTVDPFGRDSASGGRFARAIPAFTRNGAGIKQRRATPSGQRDFVTGAAAGGTVNANDVDGGITSVASPAFDLAAGSGWRLSLRYTFAHNARARRVDFFRVIVVAGGTRTVVFSRRGRAANRNAVWTPVTLNLDAFAGQRVRLLFEAADQGTDSLVEAAFDNVRVYRAP